MCAGSVDSDGDLDFVLTGEDVTIWRNEAVGSAALVQVTTGPVAERSSDSFGSGWLDYDQDGWQGRLERVGAHVPHTLRLDRVALLASLKLRGSDCMRVGTHRRPRPCYCDREWARVVPQRRPRRV